MDFFGQNVHFDRPLVESPPIGEAITGGVATAAQATGKTQPGITVGDGGGHSGSISIHLETGGHVYVKTTIQTLPVPDAFVICQACNINTTPEIA